MADIRVKLKKNPIDEEMYLGVEYIESTGTQYIQLGEDVDYNTTHLYIDYQYTNVTYSSNYIQGAVYSISYYRVYSDILWAAFASAGYGLYSYAYSKSSNGERITPNASTSRCVFERNTNGVFFNGEQKSVSQNYTPIGNSTTNITLFAMNFGNEQSITMKSKMRIYAFKLGNSEGYKYDLVPCIRKVDRVAGLYDVINKKFYTNVGTGNFVVGAETGLSYYDDTLVVYKYNGLKSVESLSQSTGQPKDIFYGVVPSDASIEIIDVNGKIADMVKKGIIENSNVQIDLLGNGKQIQTLLSTDSSYSENEKIFKATLSNEFNHWKDFYFAENKYNNLISNLKQLVTVVLTKLGYSSDSITSIMSNKIVYGISNRLQESTIEQYLSLIYTKPTTIYHEKVNAFSLMEEICSIAQLNLIKLDNGEIKFISARPQRLSTDDAIVIPKRHQFEQPTIDLMLKNKYKNVRYYEHSLSEKFETTLEETIELVNDDGELDLESTELENIYIHTADDGTQYLRFFKTVTTSGEFSRYDVNYTDENAFDFSFETGSQVSSSGNSSIYSIDATKEDYDFKYINVVRLTPYSTLNTDVFAFNIPMPSFEPEKLLLTLRAKVFRLSQLEKYKNDNSNIYEWNYSGKLLTTNFYYVDSNTGNRTNMYDLITDNIVKDYSSGINTTTMTIACADYYDTHYNKVKDWKNGEIIQVGEIVRLDKDNDGNSVWEYNDKQPLYWKVVGRKFRYVGVPLIELQLQQVVYKELTRPLYRRYGIDVNEERVIVFELTKTNGTSNIHFTLDGTIPTKDSPIYKEPFYIYDTATKLDIRAVVVEGNAVSEMAHYIVTKGSVTTA